MSDQTYETELRVNVRTDGSDGLTNLLNEYQVVTLMLAAGHTYEGLANMSPANFMGYYRATKWLNNKKLAESLFAGTRATFAGFVGGEAFERVDEQIKELRTAHNV
ncbi:Uncharacterised protein [Burkholderia pseudomallei]|uniref:hypothetical protein n=1 Tax=Burkholderia pseudomallei TaxID=28450 RepID=UPI0009785C97|nr:hypothetical protein [Burkholderia pseudomallei]OMS96424.1 hypothetical protein AQ750_04625 [Burkholderia pseudomallei]CAJ4176448.1 Uncharacterised protein [Burkholderia pseudomallei]CAJ5601590.1 Uncharacterised protein [Burkholderia pseudomallei]CAJ6079130.1 Uncharacterised protein [Burkholderia pseudomallei]CAJ6707450.1 Uncharacterised protein [Burkholderia pseudomallei]